MAVGMLRAWQSAIGLPRGGVSARWMLALLTPGEVRRSFMIPFDGPGRRDRSDTTVDGAWNRHALERPSPPPQACIQPRVPDAGLPRRPLPGPMTSSFDQRQTPGPDMNRLSAVAMGCLVAFAAPLALAPPPASGFAEPPIPAIGTRTVADAELLVPRPRTTPCTVSLFGDQEFAGFTP